MEVSWRCINVFLSLSLCGLCVLCVSVSECLSLPLLGALVEPRSKRLIRIHHHIVAATNRTLHVCRSVSLLRVNAKA